LGGDDRKIANDDFERIERPSIGFEINAPVKQFGVTLTEIVGALR
jgi:hypothetical protein